MEIIKYNEVSTRKRNLISLSIFKIKGPYRTFEKYTNYLNNLLKYLSPIINENDADVRVYFDDSCHKELQPLINNYKNIEFYKFNYPKLRIGPFHDGTFGSLVRLLPIFEIYYEYIWVDDIDIPPKNIDFKYFNFIYKKRAKTIFFSIFCYQRPWIKNNYNMNFPLITNIKLPKQIFMKFIEDVANNKFESEVKEIVKYRSDRYVYDYPVKHPYGMDEYFTNYIIYDNLTNNDKTYLLYEVNIVRILKKVYYMNISNYEKDIIKKLVELQELNFKTHDKDINRNILNTFIKLFNKLKKEKLNEYIGNEYEKGCLEEFYSFIEQYNMTDINSIKLFVKLKNYKII